MMSAGSSSLSSSYLLSTHLLLTLPNGLDHCLSVSAPANPQTPYSLLPSHPQISFSPNSPWRSTQLPKASKSYGPLSLPASTSLSKLWNTSIISSHLISSLLTPWHSPSWSWLRPREVRRDSLVVTGRRRWKPQRPIWDHDHPPSAEICTLLLLHHFFEIFKN